MKPRRDKIVMAVPKGRVLKQLGPLFEGAGLCTAPLFEDNRKLIRTDAASNIEYLLLKPDDVPTYVEYGAADIGIVGKDILLERDYDLYAPLDLQLGKCRLAVAGLPEQPYPQSPEQALRVATKFSHLATQHFQHKGISAEMIYVQGSVELAPLTGLADVIVDLVESGETLKQNGLVVKETIMDISSMFIANRVGFKLKRDRIYPLLKSFEAAVKK